MLNFQRLFDVSHTLEGHADIMSELFKQFRVVSQDKFVVNWFKRLQGATSVVPSQSVS